ncbi:MAG: saccharopine dehydrogenase NADP-binding domain-containing protein [Pseudonocardia sp.]|nr:saccharopine dehydrogenase NADP-binding domain-containing protein [Pseudonocardia sp.]
MPTTSHDDVVLVLGGTGAVGRSVTSMLVGAGVRVLAAARRPPAALPAGARFHLLDARDEAALRAAVRVAPVVVDASGLDNGAVAAAAVAAGAQLVDLSADTTHLTAVRRLDGAARAGQVTVLAGGGLAPGLTNLLAAAAHTLQPATAGIALHVLLGLGERHGPAATAWMLDQLAAPPRHPPRRVELPAGFGRHTARWVDFAEQHALTRDLAIPVISRCALDPPLLAAATAYGARVPGLRRALAAAAPTAARLTRREWWVAEARTTDGATAWATGRGQSYASAVVATWAAHQLLERRLPPGVHDLHHITDLDTLTPWLHRRGIATATTTPHTYVQ